MSSDWGGFPYPSKEGTYFVDSAIEKIKLKFGEELNSALETYNLFVEKIYIIRDTILRQKERIKEFAEEVDVKLGAGLDQVEPPPKRDIFTKIEEHYGTILSYADKAKLSGVIESISSMGVVLGYRVTADRRIEVTRRGTDRRVRVSESVIERLLAEE
jgi:hypothetical protein